jgi:hypothetical protein
LSGVSDFEIHPVGTLQSVLKSLEVAEKQMAAMMPAGVR